MELKKYQLEAIDWVVANKRCWLCLDTGLGKTVVALKAASRVADNVLVICPAFLVCNWENEISKWTPEISHRITLRSYHYWNEERTKKAILANYDMLVLDESHYLKNWKAKRTKLIAQALAPTIPRVVAMTATPYVRSAEDFHPTLSFLQPGKWGKRKEFVEKYCLKKFITLPKRKYGKAD